MSLFDRTLLFVLVAVAAAGCEEDIIGFAKPELCVRPESVEFGAQTIRMPAARAVSVTNCGSVRVERVAARIVETETPFQITTSEVPEPLVPGAFFRLGLRYRPTEEAAHTARLQLSVDNFETVADIVEVPLSGSGIPPPACLPVLGESLVFATTVIGELREDTLTFTNDGTGTCTISGVRLQDGSEAFTVIDAPAGEVAAGATQELTVRFAPRTPGAHEGRLAVIVDGDAEITAELAGDAVRSDRCALLATPPAAVFPRAITGTLDTTTQVTIESAGELDCTIESAELTAGGPAISLAGDPLAGLVLAAGTSTTVTLLFQPTANGAVTGNLRVTATGGVVLDVALSAFSDPRPSCALAFDPSPLTFAPLAVGLDAEELVSITNLSTLDCAITAVTLDAAELELTDAPPLGLLAGGASVSVNVRYRPVAAAPTLGRLEIELDGASTQGTDVVGFADFAKVRLTPGLQHVGIITEGCASAPKPITLSNTGPVAARIDRIGLSAASDPNFELQNPPVTPFMLGPSESRVLDVRMLGAPVHAGQTGEVEVLSVGAPDALVRSTLRGTSESTVAASRRDIFVQSEQAAVDVLFVIDNSCSMAAEQTSLRQNFQSFISFFTTELVVDYHIGITTTDTSAQVGALVGPYISNTTVSPVTVFGTQADVGTGGSATERGLLASVQAVTSPNTDPGGPNDGFLRDDALLSIIYVTDEEDQSPGTVASYLDQLLAVKGYRGELVLTSAIAGDVPGGCPSASAAYRYYDMVHATQYGVFESLCTPDWAVTMQQLGFTTFAALTRFKLARDPGPSTIVVIVDGVVIPNDPVNGWTYDPLTNSIVFHGDAVPDAGEQIEVGYTAECLPI